MYDNMDDHNQGVSISTMIAIQDLQGFGSVSIEEASVRRQSILDTGHKNIRCASGSLV